MPAKKPPSTRVTRQSRTSVTRKKAAAKRTDKIPTKASTRAKKPAAKKSAGTKRKAATHATKTATTRTESKRHTVKPETASQPQSLLLKASKILMQRPNLLPLMQNTARVSGVFFVVCGAIYAMYFAHVLYSDTSVHALYADSDMLALVESTALNSSTTTETVDGINDTTDDTTATVTRPAAIFYLDATNELQGTVQVAIEVPNATAVQVIAFQDTHTTEVALGQAKQVGPEEWHFAWNTELVSNGTYRIAAYITDNAQPARTYRSSHHSYVHVQNPTDTTTLDSSNTTDGTQEPATNVIKEPADTAVLDDPQISDKDVDTTDILETTTVTNLDTSSTDDAPATSSADEIKDTTSDEPRPQSDESETAIQGITVNTQSPVQDTVRVQVATEPAKAVELYVQGNAEYAYTRRFVGVATPVSNVLWQLQYDTSQTPNGQYQLVAVVRGLNGTYETKPVTMTIQNAVKAPLQTDQEVERMQTLQAPEVEPENLEDPENVTAPARSSQATTTESRLQDAYNTEYAAVEKEVDRILRTIAVANTFNSEQDIDVLAEQMEQLRNQLLRAADTTEDPEAYRQYVETHFNATIQSQQASIQAEQDKTNTQTAQESIDTDQDGVPDYDEVNIFNTDPFNPDSDNDGVIDGIEIMRGTDPLVADNKPTVYESPKEAGIERSDLLAVTSVEAESKEDVKTTAGTTAPTGAESSAVAIIRGQAIPNSFVTLYVYSQPTVVTVRTAADGSWEYRFDKELEDGSHTVYVALTDHAGRVVVKSEPFTFIKEAEAFFAAGSVLENQPQPSENSLFSSYVFYMMMSLSVISLGLVLMLIGFHIQYKRRTDSAFGAV